ncbi:MAG: rRNA methyltransferase [Bacteroidota bacterium]|nr:rRNA methyltransferase [Bacteroidota bacterium]
MSSFVTALKSYGQHFLHDQEVLGKITQLVKTLYNNEELIEVGPGMGAFTQHLLREFNVTCVEVDRRCIDYLNIKFKAETESEPPKLKIIDADFLKLDLKEFLNGQTAIVGNFPYNISSQIVFRILENYTEIPFMVGMFQKEMGHRIASKHNSKEYGVISVFAQLLYDVKMEFDIFPESFSPPPKVMSSIISMRRKENIVIDFDFKLFRNIVKAGFNQRRKMLRNGLSGIAPKEIMHEEVFKKRAEQLSVQDFIDLTKMIEKYKTT